MTRHGHAVDLAKLHDGLHHILEVHATDLLKTASWTVAIFLTRMPATRESMMMFSGSFSDNIIGTSPFLNGASGHGNDSGSMEAIEVTGTMETKELNGIVEAAGTVEVTVTMGASHMSFMAISLSTGAIESMVEDGHMVLSS